MNLTAYSQRKKRILVLCSGTGSFEKPFIEAGWEVVSVDWDKRHGADIVTDIRDIEVDHFKAIVGTFDWVHSSPDCKLYSIANSRRWHLHWDECRPISDEARASNELVEKCIAISEELSNHYWTLENPNGLLQLQPFMQRHQKGRVTYCQYGDSRMKPTNIWGKLPRTWVPKRCNYGDKCHTPSPRGEVVPKDTCSMTYDERIAIPFDLGDSLRKAGDKSEGASWFTLEDFL
jgi:hypothetical protein